MLGAEDLRQKAGRHSRRFREPPGDPLHAGPHLISYLHGGKAIHKLQRHPLRDHIGEGSPLNRAHGQDRGLDRVHFAAHDCLEGQDDLGRKNDRVLGFVRSSPVPSPAVNRQIQGLGPQSDVAGFNGDLAGGKFRLYMKRQGAIRPWKALEKTTLEHRAGSAQGFFGRLSDEKERSLPILPETEQKPGRPDENGGVHIVPASVHNRPFFP